MFLSRSLSAGSVCLAVALASSASGGVVINIVEEGSNLRVTTSGSFTINHTGSSSSNNVDVYQVRGNKIDFRTANVGTRYNFGNAVPRFTGNFGTISTNYGGVTFGTSGSLPLMISFFGDNTWKVFADPSATSYDWDVTFTNNSIATAGLTAGAYIWDLSDDVGSDTFTVNIGASTPAVPGVGAMAALGAIGLVGGRRRR